MSRNVGYHHHGRNSNKQHHDFRYDQQLAPHPRLDSIDHQQMTRGYQVPLLIPPPHPNFNQQFPVYNQQQIPQQMFIDHSMKLPVPQPQPFFSHSSDINNSNLMQYNPHINTASSSIGTSNSWFTPINCSPSVNTTSMTSTESMNHVATEALNRLQLPSNQITETGIVPNTPYYELPAGLIIPLIPANRKDYKSLNPLDLRLPLPKFPDENFLRAIDQYYGHEMKTRDNDGWDREFIDTYIGQKEALAEVDAS